MQRYFTLDGRSSADFMVHISGEDTWKKPKPIIERITVPGRNGELLSFNGAYENTDVTYHCGVTGDFDTRYSAFVNWLLSTPTYRRLEDSYHPGLYRMASVSSVIDPTLNALNRSGEFDVTFSCKPQAWLYAGETVHSFTANGKIINPTLYTAKPLLRVYGTGTVTIGSDSVTITACDGYTDLDCELQEAYKDDSSRNCNGNVVLGSDHFPTIPAGENGVILGSGITRVDITPRWWQL